MILRNTNRLKHSLAVARKMVEIGKSKGLAEEELKDLFMLGYNHDIGYEFGTNENHNVIGANILKQNNNYTTISRNRNFNISDNSWQGYGTKEQVNVDFAFIEKKMMKNYNYEIIKQDNMMDEGSDHRPVILTIE